MAWLWRIYINNDPEETDFCNILRPTFLSDKNGGKRAGEKRSCMNLLAIKSMALTHITSHTFFLLSAAAASFFSCGTAAEKERKKAAPPFLKGRLGVQQWGFKQPQPPFSRFSALPPKRKQGDDAQNINYSHQKGIKPPPPACVGSFGERVCDRPC